MKTSLFLYIPINLKEKTCTYLSFFVSLYTNFVTILFSATTILSAVFQPIK